eukprot:139802-Hanusia_phi.AAC.2
MKSEKTNIQPTHRRYMNDHEIRKEEDSTYAQEVARNGQELILFIFSSYFSNEHMLFQQS